MATISFKGTRPLTARIECGGVLIAPDRVATAAHCLDHVDPNHFEVHLGASTLSSHPGRVVAMDGFATHPGYRIVRSPVDPGNWNASGAADDVAIIQLARPQRDVPFLPVAHREPAIGAPVQVYGHGLTKPPTAGDPQASIGDVLQRGDLNVIDTSSCNAQLAGVVDQTSVLCAQSTATACSGDSGGPLVHQSPWGRELVGIVSFGGEIVDKQCGQDSSPTAFADVVTLREWITQPRPRLAPMPLGEPRIAGPRTAGATVTCELPQWAGKGPDTVQYEWDKDVVAPDGTEMFVPIDGATHASLQVAPDLATAQLLCTVTASTTGGTVALTTSPL